MASTGDPVGVGLVASLARPGGNITGLSSFSTELAGKRIELVKEMLPGISRVGLLANMSNPALSLSWEETKRVARELDLEAELLDVRNASDVGRAFDAAVARKIGAIVVGLDTFTQVNCQLIVDSAAQTRLPALYPGREFVDAGGLMSFRLSFSSMPPAYRSRPLKPDPAAVDRDVAESGEAQERGIVGETPNLAGSAAISPAGIPSGPA